MKYLRFTIENYRAIKEPLTINLEKRLIPLVGMNECGKTTVLQAIFCFDENNDKENDGVHFEAIHNLYETVDNSSPKISATVQYTNNDLSLILSSQFETLLDGADEDLRKKIIEIQTLMSKSIKEKRELAISRNLDTKLYSCDTLFGCFDQEVENGLCKSIVTRLPYILYNDDFYDRPEDRIEITDNTPKAGWEAIFDRVFRATNSHYSLNYALDQPDDKKRKSILADVKKYLDKSLTRDWAKFATGRDKISTELEIDKASKTLSITIEDTLNGNSRFFRVLNRSKGFIWYYNFIMKIRFNPKSTGDIRDTIFLLDEPGSYLHETVQANLCVKLKEISSREGVVVYCTHSPKLLNPDYVPLTNIQIVEKPKNASIKVFSIDEYPITSQKNSAMQPVFEALMLPEYEMISLTDRILCVEGIYDKYAIESFCELPKNVRVFPSVSADSIIKNIQYFVAYRKLYLALWDNDDEGKAKCNLAKHLFGTEESKNFDLLPKNGTKDRRMENMIQKDDYKTLKTALDLKPNATYETMISTLYFSSSTKKKAVLNKVSDETKGNFKILNEIIRKHFDQATH